MAVVFLVQYRLPLSVPCQCRVTSEGSRQLHTCGCLVGVGKNFGFVAFVVRCFFDRPQLSRADELCGLRRCPNPTRLSC